MKTTTNKKMHMDKKRIQMVDVKEEQCIWMKAGIVNFRKCDNAYDCNTCPFDKAMRRAMSIEDKQKSEKFISGWATQLKNKYHGVSLPCRHLLTGRIQEPKTCILNYECGHCAYDQMLDEYDLVSEMAGPEYTSASGYRLAKGYYYHAGHTWVRFEHGGQVRVGFDDFMVRLFGVANTLTLPPLGMKLVQNKTGWTFGRNGHEAAVLAPVTGTVLAVNHKVGDHPEIVHTDPYNEGWQMIIGPDMPKRNVRGLYYGEESFYWMQEESQRLMGLLGEEYQDLAATGGEPVSDVFGTLKQIGWDVLVREFLGSARG